MPFINKDFINYLPQQADIVGLINKRVPLTKKGKDYKACCPFHNEKTPSFSVSPAKQAYYCFGCGGGGGVIDFVMKFDNLNFTEAIHVIASESGINVIYDKGANPVSLKTKDYYKLMQQVSSFYKNKLKCSVFSSKIISYIKTRQISSKAINDFELGFAPVGWDNLLRYFENDEEASLDLKKMGLVVDKDTNSRSFDHFRNRLMFPIHNSRGNIIAFGGRVISADDKPKYLNSPETPIFAKSKELYGLYQCRKYSRSLDYVLIVEGYLDVIALNQYGITQTVATLGTAITTQHLQTLSRVSNIIIFCFDGDKAGLLAAWKALKIVLPIVKAGLIIKFLFLPIGEDPDTIIRKESVQHFKNRIDKAHTLSRFLFAHIKAEVDFDTIEGKTLFLEKVSILIGQVNYDIYKQQLIEGIAGFVKQSIEQVKTIFAHQKPLLDKPKFIDLSISAVTKSIKITSMAKIIKLLLNYPSLANNSIKNRVEKIDKAEVLLQLLLLSKDNKNISQKDLLEPFKSKINVYNRLQQLCTLSPYLSEDEAKEEFLSSLTAMEKQQKKANIKASIYHAKTQEQQSKIAENIKKGKLQS